MRPVGTDKQTNIPGSDTLQTNIPGGDTLQTFIPRGDTYYSLEEYSVITVLFNFDVG